MFDPTFFEDRSRWIDYEIDILFPQVEIDIHRRLFVRRNLFL